MNETELLALEKNAHLTVRELRTATPELARPFLPMLEARAQREVMGRFAPAPDVAPLRPILERVEIRSRRSPPISISAPKTYEPGKRYRPGARVAAGAESGGRIGAPLTRDAGREPPGRAPRAS